MVGHVFHGVVEAPVVDHEGDVLQVHGLDKAAHEVHVAEVTVLDIRLVRLAETDQVEGDAAAQVFHIGHDVAPQVDRGRCAVDENDGIAVRLPALHVVHLVAVHFHVLALVGEVRRRQAGGVFVGLAPLDVGVSLFTHGVSPSLIQATVPSVGDAWR